MVKKRIRCPYCASLRTKKKGKQGTRQRYGCNDCKKRFQIKKRDSGLARTLWDAYTNRKQTLAEISRTYGKSHVWVRKQLDSVAVSMPDTPPQ